MATKTEGNYSQGFILSKGNGTYSVENGTLILGQNLGAGRVLGKITASGKYTALAPAAVDGSQTAAGILLAAVDATAADKTAGALVREAEVIDTELDWGTMTAPQITTAKAQLAALVPPIIVRAGI